MKTRMAATAAALVLSAALSAPQAMAAPSTWEMPDIRGMNLAAAEKAFTAATEGSGLKLTPVNLSGPGEVLNLTNWTVCSQSPKAGGTLRAKSTPAVGVNRPNNC
ncbi:PASTA domain-containing protein [Mycolicibacterium litorale]|nr:PASTA domain-containing protein [Mycolicibacterium litorale]MCV7416412.1 PASTA domain-containing protein [Mycolicibacterium litorale]TDY09666.1 PASTA domain-containing protein [Mycolicibacterium litorale]